MKFGKLAFAVAVLALPASFARADVWDTASDTDNTTGTDNVPTSGAIQVHDMSAQPGPVADTDFYTIDALPFTSHEAIIDSLTGDTGGSLIFNWLAADGTTVLSTGRFFGSASCTACTQSATFENNSVSTTSVFIEVSNAACGTACTGGDQYTFRYYETTIDVPRFNNFGTQTTTLVMHNVSEFPINGHVNLFNTAGTFLGQQAFSLVRNQTLVQNTATMPGGAGVAGVINITHDGRYAGLAGKTVVIDPGTGFSFDTPFVYKPH